MKTNFNINLGQADLKKGSFGCGDCFIMDDSLYMLCQTGPSMVSLVKVGKYSNRFLEPVEVLDTSALTQSELAAVMGNPGNFVFVSNVNIEVAV